MTLIVPGTIADDKSPVRLRFQARAVDVSSPSVIEEARTARRPLGTSKPGEIKGQPIDAPEKQQLVLFSKRADLKVQMSKIVMHLSDTQRRDLFKQIDELLDIDNWSEDDSLIDDSSFGTFLRFMVHQGRLRRPSLTVSVTGNIAASWFGKGHRLTVEFLRGDKIRCVCRRDLTSGDVEASAYEGPMLRLDEVLRPFDASGWYRNDAARLT